MRRASRILASSLGAFAGFGGSERGIFEIMRGSTRPGVLIMSSIGPPCHPVTACHISEPATGIAAGSAATGISRPSAKEGAEDKEYSPVCIPVP
ncbi:MAG: hypothetical protein GF417_00300 [Candidatus Latescibacteria bacterium]|nr:hypothetical protein [bacterium]MBD3422868.1 hypothetical protein [Candidatus Latescibacterota bacterium]